MSEKQYVVVFVVLLAVILLLGGGAFYYLQFVVLQERQDELAAITAKVDDAKRKDAEIKDIVKENDSLKDDIAKKQQRIPDLSRAEYDAFANLLDDLRKQAGVSVSSGRWVQATKAQQVPGRLPRNYPVNIHKVQYDLAVSGGFFQLLKFINLLEQHPRFMNVESFTITPATGVEKLAPGAMRRDMKLTLYSFTYKTEIKLPDVPEEARRAGLSTPLPE